MSYPYDSPSLSMSTVWASGNYTPNDVVRVIRDNYTPVNKNSMRNSVGQEISLLQNYVNSKYLGREDTPINTGFINEVVSLSGRFYVSTENNVDYGYLSAGELILYNGNQDPQNGLITLNKNILNTYSLGVNTVDQWWIKHNHFYMDTLDFASSPAVDNTFNMYPNSGLSFNHFNATRGSNCDLYVRYSGIEWSYSATNGESPVSVGLFTNSGVGSFLYTSGTSTSRFGQLALGSGQPYDYYCGLTVGEDAGGDAFFKTHGGGGIYLTGDNGIYDRIVSNASNSFFLTAGVSNLVLYTESQTDWGAGLVSANGSVFDCGALNVFAGLGTGMRDTLGAGDMYVSNMAILNSCIVDNTLTVSGNAYFNTTGGGTTGITLSGALGFDVIKSHSSAGLVYMAGPLQREVLLIDPVVGARLVGDLSIDGSYYSYSGVAFNAIATGLTPTGIAAVQTGSPTGTDATIITEILNVLKNVGLMAKS